MSSLDIETKAYNPMAILNLFNNAISVQETRKLIQVKGIYIQGKGANYNGYFYDFLRDESSDASLTLIVPALIRNHLVSNKTIVFFGYITRRVVNNGGRIELQLTITELVEQTVNKYTDGEVKAIELLQKKVALGYRDVTSFIKSRIISETPITIVILVGRNGIIDSDIKHQLRESIAEYTIFFEKINLSSEGEILSAMNRFNSPEIDILVIARGGGENLEIFNKPEIAETSLHLSPYFLTAIGHKEDTTLLQKIADKPFITPSEFGQYLNDLYNSTKEELQNSKARLVEAITTQLKANYEQQLENLNGKLIALEELKNKNTEDMSRVYTEQIQGLNSQIALLNKNHEFQATQTAELQSEKLTLLQHQIGSLQKDALSKDELMDEYKSQLQSVKSSKPLINWALIIAAALIGLIIGLLLKMT